jgi:glycosyltransferase involved in cell wall biosynthesis
LKLSVIVCTQNRAHAIIGCLESIAQAMSVASPLDAEIVVVDNASEDDTSTVVKRWGDSCAFPVRLLFEPKKGLAVARNCGIDGAQGDLLVFTDDDCRLSPEYVIDLLRHDAMDRGLVLRGGRVELGEATDLPLTIKTSRDLTRWHRSTNAARHENLGNCIVGCNMAMRRAVVERIGPFDGHFSGTHIRAGEDVDYVLRAYLANITIEYVPDMMVFHYHGRKLPADGKKLLRNYAIGTGALYAKFFFKDPNLCRQFFWDIKTSIKEIISGKSNSFPEVNFARHTWLAYCVLGTIWYIFVVVTSPFQTRRDGR